MKKFKNAKIDIHSLLNIIIVFLIIILILVGYYFYYQNSPTKDNNITKQTFSRTSNNKFVFNSINGKKFELVVSDKIIKIKELEDKIVFLKIFGWDCQYCKKEIPQLINLKKDLGDTFDVIAIEAQQHSNEESLKYIKKYGINYNIINGNNQNKFYEYLKTHYGWNEVIPLTIVIGKGGNILAYEVGAKSYTLAELMKASLAREKSYEQQR
ncbi:MAG: redoxin domain-containing protein [Epsilonproteobacteria bacterium]|nr:redoxin domain-containing protein [Campylobacterota bacterium]